MRHALLAAMLLLPFLPSAGAEGSSVSVTGPASLDAEGPATANMLVRLALDRVVCTREVEIPVKLRIADARGLRSAELTWDQVRFRVGPQAAALGPWAAEAQAGLRVWARDPVGVASVVASFVLPPECSALGGATSGEATYTLEVRGGAAAPAPEPAPRAPMTKADSALAPPARPEDASASLPWPVVGAIVGMLAGGVGVVWKRTRRAPA